MRPAIGDVFTQVWNFCGSRKINVLNAENSMWTFVNCITRFKDSCVCFLLPDTFFFLNCRLNTNPQPILSP